MERFDAEKISSEEMAILDNNSEWLGIPKSHLMECAGYSCAIEIVKRYNLKRGEEVSIFCGTGNNGGDGFVVARHLSSFGIKVLVVLCGSSNSIRTKEAQLNWSIISKHLNKSIQIEVMKDSTDIARIKSIFEEKNGFSIIIDGLLGTGVKGKIREPISTAIDFINEVKKESRTPVVAIDVPSGFDPNTGTVPDKAVKSDLTITFHRLKKGMNPETEFMKEIAVKSIGIPLEATLFVGRGNLIPTLKSRKVDVHKGQFGRILVIGGSQNYSGAPAYSSLTCINFGIDLVITYTPQIVGDVIRSYSPNMIVRTSPGNWLDLSACNEISQLIEWSNSVLIGPGLGIEKETEFLVVELIKKLKRENKSFVLDADSLKLVKNHQELIKGQSVILTPHEGELKIMAGVDLPPYNQLDERMTIIANLAKELNVTLLVKGPYDFISNGVETKINRSGVAEMSIGGTGDVLAGLCACFLATNNNPFESACSAAFLNGLIGEYCKRKIGARFTAIDLIGNINHVISEISNFRI